MADFASSSAAPYILNGHILGGLVVDDTDSAFEKLMGGSGTPATGTFRSTLDADLKPTSIVAAINSLKEYVDENNAGQDAAGPTGSIQMADGSGGLTSDGTFRILGENAIDREESFGIHTNMTGSHTLAELKAYNLLSGSGGINAAGISVLSASFGSQKNAMTISELGVITADGISNLNGGIAVDTDKFTVSAAGDIAVDTDKFTVSAAGAVGAAGNITSQANVVGNLLTDGSFSVSSGAITGVTTLSASGVASIASVLSAGNITSQATLAGDTLTDGILSLNSGAGTGIASLSGSSFGLSDDSLVGVAAGNFSGKLQAGTFTDGTLSLNSGAGTDITSLSGSSFGLSDDSLVGVAAGNFSGKLQAGTFTDGTLSINAGAISAGVSATFSGLVTAGSFNDGVATYDDGVISSGVSATFSGLVTAGSFNDGVATYDAGVVTAAVGLSGSSFKLSDDELAGVQTVSSSLVTYAGNELQLHGSDADGDGQQYKLEVIGGLLRVNEVS